MLNNLSAEMARYGYNSIDLANVGGFTERTARSKIAGETEFSIVEAVKIRDSLFPAMRLEYLFKNSQTD